MKNLLTRTLTGILFISIITAAVLAGAYAFLIVFGIIALLGYIEFLNLTQLGRRFDQGLFVVDMAGACALFLAIFSFSGQIPANMQKAAILTYLIYLAARPIIQLYKSPDKSPVAGWAYSILGQIYVVLPLALLSVWGYSKELQLLLGHPEYLLMALFVFVWTNDTGAYIVGCTLGKHRLFERISPKKSWEGSIGGGILALASAFVFASCFPSMMSTAEWLGLAFVVILFGTWGDLTESLLKRTLGIKDSGTILPGHGGFLDRFDSALMAIPAAVIYLYAVSLA